MSLEKRYSHMLEKSAADSVNIGHSYLNRIAEDLAKSDSSANIYNYCLESHLSSEYSESSKASIEIDGLRFSQEIEKVLAKHLKQTSVVENNVTNNYEGMLGGLKNISLGKISEVSYEDKENKSYSIAKEESKLDSYSESNNILTENTVKLNIPPKKTKLTNGNTCVSLRNSTFALTSRIFCMKCCSEVYTNVTYKMKNMNVWGSIGFFFDAIKCCGEPRAMSRYQELVHTCKQCGTIVARISTT